MDSTQPHLRLAMELKDSLKHLTGSPWQLVSPTMPTTDDPWHIEIWSVALAAPLLFVVQISRQRSGCAWDGCWPLYGGAVYAVYARIHPDPNPGPPCGPILWYLKLRTLENRLLRLWNDARDWLRSESPTSERGRSTVFEEHRLLFDDKPSGAVATGLSSGVSSQRSDPGETDTDEGDDVIVYIPYWEPSGTQEEDPFESPEGDI